MSRKRFQEQRSRSWNWYRSVSRGRSFSCDRPPSLRRDSHSQTRAVNNKSDFRSNHGRDFERCIGCPCKACKNHREFVYNIKESSEKQGEMNVSLRSSKVDAAWSYQIQLVKYGQSLTVNDRMIIGMILKTSVCYLQAPL